MINQNFRSEVYSDGYFIQIRTIIKSWGEYKFMKKRFNTTGICVERKHYMVDISDKLMEIKEQLKNHGSIYEINPESNHELRTHFK